MAFSFNDNIVFSVDTNNSHFIIKYGYLLEVGNDDTYHIVDASYNVGQDNAEPEFGFDEDDAYPISEIYSCALYNKPSLKSLKFGSALKKIGWGAFSNSENLEYVDLSKTAITSIENNTFNGCIKLNKLYEGSLERKNINGHLHSVGCYAFSGTNITKLNLGEEKELTSLQPLAFADMKELKQIVLPNSIQYMFSSILSGCNKLGEGVNYAIIYMGEYADWQSMPSKSTDWWKGLDEQVIIRFEGSNISRTVKDA